MRHATILVAILAFVPLASAAQEQQRPLEPGARIRLWYCHPFFETLRCERGDERKLVALTADSLVLQVGAVSRASVTKIEVRGSPHVVLGAVIGSVAGALVGGLSMALQPDSVTERKCTKFIVIDLFGSTDTTTYTECETITREIFNDVTVGVVVGALGGAVLGAVAGHRLRRWTEVPLDRVRVSLGPQRDGRFGFGASVRF